jgi:nitrogen fixation/metabolism regulation signal transduction histidine kinase
MGIRQERRRNYFIDKSFQTKFIINFCILLVFASILIASLTYFRNMQTTTVAFENLRVVVKTTADFIIPIVIEVLLIVTALSATATIIVTLFASHKIAGPLYKLTQDIQKIKKGDLTSTVRIRATDQMQLLATEFNDLRLALNATFKDMKADVAELAIAIEKIDVSALSAKDKKKIESALGSIEKKIAEYKTV